MNGINIDLHTEEIVHLCKRYKVKELSVFGSAVKDDFTPESDIDILVEFRPEAIIGFMEFAGMQFELEKIFGRKVDLVSKTGLNSIIKDEVIGSSQVLYAA